MEKRIKLRPRKSLDLELLRSKIRTLNRQQKLYEILRDELSALGYWKKHPRGNPKLGGQMSKLKRSKNGTIRN